MTNPLTKKHIRVVAFLGVVALLAILVFSYTMVPLAFAGPGHGNEVVQEEIISEKSDFMSVDAVKKLSIKIAIAALISFIALTIMAFSTKESGPYAKKIIFTMISIVVITPTLYFIFSTVYINLTSETGGPVHWHADYRIFACGEELEVSHIEGAANKTGTDAIHGHEDKRIHVEGVLTDKSEASLSNFFTLQESTLTDNSFSISTSDGVRSFSNGDACTDGKSGEWQVFLYTTEEDVVTQTKLTDYTDYILTPANTVPPGDCVILEFGEEKDRTENLCDFYTVEINKGNLELQ